MGRIYYVDLTPTAVTVAADLLEITPATNKPVIIRGLSIGQTTDTGDAAEEIIGLLWVRGHTTSGSGGSSPTPRPKNPTDAAAGFTCETFNTTQASAGTGVNLPRHLWNVRIGLERPYTPEEAPEASAANTTLVLRMAAAPADSITISGYVVVEELG
jgi:hypothetical protein